MSYWDTSSLVKLSIAEPDSVQFQQLAACAARIVTANIARLEARTVFRRREAEGALPAGEASVLSAEMDRDVADGRVAIQAADAEVEREFANVLEKCFSQTPPVFIRTNDALHIASAIVAGEAEFITADLRQRAAVQLMGLTAQP
jgi:predicted nucleic acid-binding protein